jgi:hypothetical protein
MNLIKFLYNIFVFRLALYLVGAVRVGNFTYSSEVITLETW